MKNRTFVFLLIIVTSITAFTQSIKSIREPYVPQQSREVTVPDYGQSAQSLSDKYGTGGSSRDFFDLACPSGSGYSQLPGGAPAWSYIGGFAYYDNVLSAPGGLVTSITWWMLEEDVVTLTFDIFVREDDGSGKPDMVNPPKYSFTGLTVTETNTGETDPAYGLPVYVYTYNFPYSLTINAGDWIGIADFPDTDHHHYWCTSHDGDSQIYCPHFNGYYNTDLAWCLGVFDILCPDESLYSQLPDGVDGWSSSTGYVIYDNILSVPAGTVGSITWWMQEFTNQPSLTFDIIIREDNAGVPGPIKTSFTNLTVPGINTGRVVEGYPVFEFTYVFPAPVTIAANDWIGIADYPDGGHYYFWLTSSEGDFSSYFIDNLGNPVYLGPTDLAFCLSPSFVTPISDWAIGIGIFLIIAATLFRLKRF